MATKTSGRVPADPIIDTPRRQSSAGIRITASIVGLLLLAASGWVAWNQGAVVGLRLVDFDSPLALAVFGFVAGIGAVFAPCAFSLFPAYISYYLTAAGTGPESPRRSLALGLTCAAGSATFFALAAVAITMLGGVVLALPRRHETRHRRRRGVVRGRTGRDVRLPSFSLPFGSGWQRLPSMAGLFVYGFGSALTTTGCALPIYVSIIVLPLTSGLSGAALITFVSFAAAMAFMMVLTSCWSDSPRPAWFAGSKPRPSGSNGQAAWC